MTEAEAREHLRRPVDHRRRQRPRQFSADVRHRRGARRHDASPRRQAASRSPAARAAPRTRATPRPCWVSLGRVPGVSGQTVGDATRRTLNGRRTRRWRPTLQTEHSDDVDEGHVIRIADRAGGGVVAPRRHRHAGRLERVRPLFASPGRQPARRSTTRSTSSRPSGFTVDAARRRAFPIFWDISKVDRHRSRRRRRSHRHGHRRSTITGITVLTPRRRSAPRLALLELLGDEERQLEALHVVQARVAQRSRSASRGSPRRSSPSRRGTR